MTKLLATTETISTTAVKYTPPPRVKYVLTPPPQKKKSTPPKNIPSIPEKILTLQKQFKSLPKKFQPHSPEK